MVNQSIRLDVPIAKSEAKTRGVRTDLSRLVICSDLPLLAETIVRIQPTGKDAFVHSVGAIDRFKELQDQFESAGVQVDTELEVARTGTREQLETVLSTWRAEMLVVFFANASQMTQIVSSLTGLEAKWWKHSEGGFESPYLAQLNIADPYLFYSPTRSAVEIIGTRDRVMATFDAARKVLI